MKNLLKSILSPRALRIFRKTRMVIQAYLTFPKYLYIEDTNITIRAHNWPVYMITRTGSVKNGHFYYEQKEMEFVREMMKNKKVFYDVGASMGYYSYVAIAHGVRHAVAFEPIDAQTKVIREAVNRQSLNIRVVSDPVGRKGQPVVSDNAVGHAEKKAITIDAFALETGQYPDLIKIDVEGYEADVIFGAQEILKKYHPDIVLSIHPLYLKALGHDAEELIAQVKNLGYKEIYKEFCGMLFLRHNSKDE